MGHLNFEPFPNLSCRFIHELSSSQLNSLSLNPEKSWKCPLQIKVKFEGYPKNSIIESIKICL